MSRTMPTSEGRHVEDSHVRAPRRWRRWAIRGALSLGALVIGIVGVASLYQFAASSLERARLALPGELVQAGDHSLYVHCTGERAALTIVLENGMGVVSEGWAWVHKHLSERYRVCGYDRAGTGWSPAAARPVDASTAFRQGARKVCGSFYPRSASCARSISSAGCAS